MQKFLKELDEAAKEVFGTQKIKGQDIGVGKVFIHVGKSFHFRIVVEKSVKEDSHFIFLVKARDEHKDWEPIPRNGVWYFEQRIKDDDFTNFDYVQWLTVREILALVNHRKDPEEVMV